MPDKRNIIDNVVESWPGFFTSSWIYERGLFLIIDNISKFLSVEDCNSLIRERAKRYD